MRATIFAICCVVASLAADEPRPIVDFQRAADSYAFMHRQVERRLGLAHRRAGLPEDIGTTELAAAIVAERQRHPLPPLFTPPVAAAFRTLAIRAVYRGCEPGELRSGVWEMAHDVNSPATGSRPVPKCLSEVLPQLPEELEYRSAGTVLLLVDTHANLVVDVLPALMAGSEIR